MSVTLDAIRDKYPQYDSVPDEELTIAIGNKYPVYRQTDSNFNQEFSTATIKSESMLIPKAKDSAIGMPIGETQANGTVTPMSQPNNPEANQAEFEKGLSTPGRVASGAVADIAAGISGNTQFAGNVPAALNNELMPIDAVLSDAAKESKLRGEKPTAAIVGRISQGIAATAPMIPLLGGLPAAAQKLALAGFTAKMISDAPEIATQLGDELGKPVEQQDPDKIAQLTSSAIQTVGFSVLGTVGLKRATLALGDIPATRAEMFPDTRTGPMATGAVLQTPKGAQPPSLTPLTDEALKQTIGGTDAKTIRSDTGQLGETRPPIKGGQENSGNDLQQAPPEQSTTTGQAQEEVNKETAPVTAQPPEQNSVPPETASSNAEAPATTEATATAEGNVTPPVTQTDLQPVQDSKNVEGATSAIEKQPAPAETSQDITALKYKLIDQQRAEQGLEPLPKPETVGDKEVADKALEAVRKNPNLPEQLVEEINSKPRPLNPEESIVILNKLAEVKNERNAAHAEVNRLFEEKEKDPSKEADYMAAKVRDAAASDELHKVQTAARYAGTEQGRAFRLRQLLANEDFSFASLETQRRAAKGGKPLTEAENTELTKTAEDYKKADEALQKHLSGEEPIHPKVLELAKKIIENLDRRADSARIRLKARQSERAQRTFSGIDPTVLADLKDAAEIGASHLAHGIADFAEWSSKVIEDVGDWVKPHLDDLFKRSQGMLEGMNAPEEVKRVITRRVNGSKVVSDAISKVYGDESKSATKDIVSDLKSNPIDSERQRVADAAANDLKNAQSELETSKVQEEAAKRAQDVANKVIREAAITRAKEETKQRISDVKRAKETASIQDKAKRIAQAAIDKTVREEAIRKTRDESKQRIEDAKRAKETAQIQAKAANKAKHAAQKRVRQAAIDSARAARKALVTPGIPAWKKSLMNLEAFKKRTKGQINELEAKMAVGDYSTKPKPTPLMDREAMDLQAKRDRVVQKFQEGQERIRLANRQPWEKALDFTSDLKRFNVLTSATVIPKLISAGLQRLTTMPLEELIGSAWRQVPIVKQIAAKAPLEGGGLNVTAEMKGYGEAFTKGIKDAYDVAKTGKSDLDVLYGKGKSSYSGETTAGSAILEFPGRIHGAIKSPVKRAAFERAVQILGEFYAKQKDANGKPIDVTDPMVKIRIATEAYKAANRSIFLEDNRVVSAYKAAVGRLEAKDATIGSKAVATGLKLALPIVRVPTNIAVETMRYALGSINAPVRVVFALSKGMENLKPEEADAIMRNLKKGSIGAAVLALGYYNADNIGGYYQPGKKQSDADVKYGSVRMFGVNVPSYLLHNPLLETMQIGATIRKIAESKLRKKDTEPQGIPAGIAAAALGVSDEIPFVREMSEMDKLRNPYTRNKFIKQQATDLVIPKIVQQGYSKSTNMLSHAP